MRKLSTDSLSACVMKLHTNTYTGRLSLSGGRPQISSNADKAFISSVSKIFQEIEFTQQFQKTYGLLQPRPVLTGIQCVQATGTGQVHSCLHTNTHTRVHTNALHVTFISVHMPCAHQGYHQAPHSSGLALILFPKSPYPRCYTWSNLWMSRSLILID